MKAHFLFWERDGSINFYSKNKDDIKDSMIHDGVYQVTLEVPDNFPEGFDTLAGSSIPSVYHDKVTGTVKSLRDRVVTPEEKRERMSSLSARQFRLGLIQSGRSLAQVDTVIAAIEDPEERAAAEVEWQYATSFNRTHPLVVSLSAALGFTPEEVDALWEQALAL